MHPAGGILTTNTVLLYSRVTQESTVKCQQPASQHCSESNSGGQDDFIVFRNHKIWMKIPINNSKILNIFAH